MDWDGGLAAWKISSPLSLGVIAVTSTQPKIEFDEVARNIHLTIPKKLTPNNLDVIIRVNTKNIVEFNQNWLNNLESTSSTYVFPCEELFEHREYEENTFKINIGSFSESLTIPPKIEKLLIYFSSISVEKTIVGRIVLKINGVTLQSEFQKISIHEILIDLENPDTFSVLENIGKEMVIPLSDIKNIFKIPEHHFPDEVKNLKIVFAGKKDAISFSGFDEVMKSNTSIHYYFTSFKDGKIVSTNSQVDQISFSIKVGLIDYLTFFRMGYNHSQLPQVTRVISETPYESESIPLELGASIESSQKNDLSISDPIHFRHQHLNFIIFEPPSNKSRATFLEVDFKVEGIENIIFEIPFPSEGIEYFLIALPGKLLIDHRSFYVSIENIQFVDFVNPNLYGELHGSNPLRKVCISGDDLDISHKPFFEAQRGITVTKPLFNGEIVLCNTKWKEGYLLGGQNENYRQKDGFKNFCHQSITIGGGIECHMLSSNIIPIKINR